MELESNWPRTKRSTMQLLPTPECPSSTSFTRRFFPSPSGEPSPLSADAVEDLVGALHDAPMLCGYCRGDLAAASGAATPAGRFGPPGPRAVQTRLGVGRYALVHTLPPR